MRVGNSKTRTGHTSRVKGSSGATMFHWVTLPYLANLMCAQTIVTYLFFLVATRIAESCQPSERTEPSPQNLDWIYKFPFFIIIYGLKITINFFPHSKWPICLFIGVFLHDDDFPYPQTYMICIETFFAFVYQERLDVSLLGSTTPNRCRTCSTRI